MDHGEGVSADEPLQNCMHSWGIERETWVSAEAGAHGTSHTGPWWCQDNVPMLDGRQAARPVELAPSRVQAVMPTGLFSTTHPDAACQQGLFYCDLTPLSGHTME